jgi:ubiquitin-protein ligase E3 C
VLPQIYWCHELTSSPVALRARPTTARPARRRQPLGPIYLSFKISQILPPLNTAILDGAKPNEHKTAKHVLCITILLRPFGECIVAMFSTFTGNSRRPRNVNLSGGAGNPFANTSWSPSAVSNTTKTVTDAQAEREKRQAERQRLKAAGRIQRTWRGHKARTTVADSRRAAFDLIYASSAAQAPQKHLPVAFSLLLSFCKPNRRDDLQRLFQYVNDTQTVDLPNICPAGTHPCRIRRLVDLIVNALQAGFVPNG